MHPTEPEPTSKCFSEGLEARAAGKTLHDNPYAAGSAQRREWEAGFGATLGSDDEDRIPGSRHERRAAPLED